MKFFLLAITFLIVTVDRANVFAQSVGVEPSSKQERPHSDLYFGVRAGTGNTGQNWDPAPPSGGVILENGGGLRAGIQFDYWVSPHYAIGVQCLYDETDVSDVGSYDHTAGFSSFGSIRTNYLEIPLTFKLRVGGPVVLPYTYAGPDLRLLLSATNEYTIGRDSSVTKDVKDAFTSSDLAALLGVGVEFRHEHDWSFFVDACYEMGMTNINSGNTSLFSDYINTVTSRTVKSWAFQFSVGIAVPL
jgi:hypothetical protein